MKVSECHGGFTRVSTDKTTWPLQLEAPIKDFTAGSPLWLCGDGEGKKSGVGFGLVRFHRHSASLLNILCRDSPAHSTDCLFRNLSLAIGNPAHHRSALRCVGRISCYFIVSSIILSITYVMDDQIKSFRFQELEI